MYVLLGVENSFKQQWAPRSCLKMYCTRVCCIFIYSVVADSMCVATLFSAPSSVIKLSFKPICSEGQTLSCVLCYLFHAKSWYGTTVSVRRNEKTANPIRLHFIRKSLTHLVFLEHQNWNEKWIESLKGIFNPYPNSSQQFLTLSVLRSKSTFS